MFQLISGSAKIEYYPKTASTAIKNGALLSSATGQLIPASATTHEHVGISLREVKSTDADYAEETMIPVLVPSQDAIFEGTGDNLTAALVNTHVDLTDSVTVNGSASARKALLLVRYISATKGWFKINSIKGYVSGVSVQ